VKADVQIETDGIRAKVIVDGEDITDHINEYALTHKAGELPVLTISFSVADVAVEGNASIEIPEKVRSFFKKYKISEEEVV